MAIKADMRLVMHNIKYKSDAAIRAGSAVIFKTQTSPGGQGQGINEKATVVTNYAGAPPSGTKCVGVAINDVISTYADTLPRTLLRPSQQFVGEPVLIGEIAEVWTNEITGTPAQLGDAYLAAGSTFGTTSVNSNPVVGKWMTTKDTDGYALLFVNAINQAVSST